MIWYFAQTHTHKEREKWNISTLSLTVILLSLAIRKLFTWLTHFSSAQSLSRVQIFLTPWIATTRPPCPSPSPGVHSDSRPSSRWCHPAISLSVFLFSCPQTLPTSGSFPVSQLCMRWPKYWGFSFSISPSNEYSGLISFRIDWLGLLAVQRTLRSLL